MNNLSRGIATHSYNHIILHFLIALSLVFACPLFAKAECSSSIGDYSAIPPFLSGGVEGNLLLMLDNSGSMYDLAYVDDQAYCYDDNYTAANVYAGYFDRGVWYYYDQTTTTEQFEPRTGDWSSLSLSSEWTDAAGTGYDHDDVHIKVNSDNVTAFFAKGNFLNWATASKLDIQKKILTGGKYEEAGTYGAPNGRLVMESRGCLDRRFVKQVPVIENGITYYLTLGIRPPDDDEKANASDDTTRIEIYNIQGGFDNTACQDAIDELAVPSPNQGNLKGYIDDCMGYVQGGGNTLLANSRAAFNHSIHNCWYMAKNDGNWPNGEGSIQKIKNDCEAVYQNMYDKLGQDVNPAPLIQPEDRAYVCYGDCATGAGYVGWCWNHSNVTFDLNGKIAISGFSDNASEIGGCIETALQDYCGMLKVPEVIDPSDQASETSEFWNIPAVLIDSGLAAQLDEPLAVLKGYIKQDEVPTGLIQEFADDLRIGAMIFNDYGSDSECNETDSSIDCLDPDNRDGGKIISYIDQDGNHTDDLVSAINDIKATCWTPIAEAMYTAIGYYTQNSDLRLNPDDFLMDANHTDPVQFWCQANNVLIITEGASTKDQNQEVINFINGQTDDDDTDVADCGSLDGSTYLDDLTYYAKNGDIYPEDNKQIDGEDKENITTHIVVAGTLRSANASNECSPDILLQNAALNGGTSLYNPADPSELEKTLREVFSAIRAGAAAGSAASVISASRSGEGVIYQAIFFPKYSYLSGDEVNWWGEVHALFVDDYGKMYEDTNENDAFDPDADRIIEFDGETGLANLYNYDSETEEKTLADANVTINDIKFIWDTTSWLSDPDMDVLTQRTYASTDHKRYIFTDYINTGANVSMSNVDSTNIMDFTIGFVNDATNDNYYFLNPDLTYDDDNNTSTPEVGRTEDQMITEAQNIISFVRGEEGLSETGTGTQYRDRTLDIDGNDTVYRIGDIIYSTPTVVSQPSENYDLLYKDDSYRVFRKQYLNRRIVVYAGANDGMLHAFNGGFYDAGASKFTTQPEVWDSSSSSFIPDTNSTNYDLGSELWAYVPNALLPHLKWLKESLDGNTTHVYYVDLKPRIFDARIFYRADGVTPLDDDHPEGWGTILIGGMRLGGGQIGVDTTIAANGDPAPDGTCDLNFRSTFFALDITNPEVAPSLLWSFSDDNLGFTTSYPTPIRVGSKWFVVIGSGPVDYEATRKDNGINLTEYGGSNRTASVYILNAANGTTPAKEFSMDAAPHSFMAAPIAVDFDLATDPVSPGPNDSVLWTGEAIYIASDGCDDEQEGRVFRIKTNEDEDPNYWTKSLFFNPNSTSGHQHINTAISVARDDEGRIWVYFGTGRFWSRLDRQSDPVNYLGYQNAFYGIKEPVVDANGTLTYATPGAQKSNLLNVTGIEVIEEGKEEYNRLSLNGAAVSDQDDDGNVTFSDLEAEVRAKDGWYLNFSETGERNLGQAAVLGNIVTFSTFVPNNDLCAYEGRSYLYGLYYKTGTAYWKGVLKTDDNNGTGIGPDNKVVSKIDLGRGYSETPNVHTGREAGSKAFVQTSTGAIISIEQANPGITKGGKTSWQEH